MQYGDLMFKTKIVCDYLVERFTKDFDDRGLLGLYVEKCKIIDGYYIKFENKNIYYDFCFLAEEKDVSKSGKYLLGTYYIYLMNDKASKNDYYIYFLTIMKKLFEKQSEFNINNETTSPILLMELDRYFNKNINIQT